MRHGRFGKPLVKNIGSPKPNMKNDDAALIKRLKSA
jgi:hypothetical protein